MILNTGSKIFSNITLSCLKHVVKIASLYMNKENDQIRFNDYAPNIESPFSVSLGIWDFMQYRHTFFRYPSKITIFHNCFLIHFHIFECFSFEFGQVYLTAVAPPSHVWTNVLLFCFLHSCKQHTRTLNRIWVEENFHLSLSNAFDLFDQVTFLRGAIFACKTC